MNEAPASSARTLVGVVVSNRMDKTIAVEIERRVRHPLYGKYVRRTTRVLAHDEGNQCQEGDRVAIRECRPLSKRKAFVLEAVLEQATVV
jgi:small subunit ribosomal protein S17